MRREGRLRTYKSTDSLFCADLHRCCRLCFCAALHWLLLLQQRQESLIVIESSFIWAEDVLGEEPFHGFSQFGQISTGISLCDRITLRARSALYASNRTEIIGLPEHQDHVHHPELHITPFVNAISEISDMHPTVPAVLYSTGWEHWTNESSMFNSMCC